MEADMDFLRTASLMIATLTVGVMAGVFAIYANAIMPGLGQTDDRTFVRAFRAIDTAIINPLFLLSFFGALVFTGIAGVLHRGEQFRSVLPWIVVAFVLYLVAVVITVVVNVPLNDGIKAAGTPDSADDLARIREQFNEARWVRWNLVRAVTTSVVFGCLAWALVLGGRVTGSGGG